mmetsp:Transcript_45388/g.94485  ORF Transcript_45388/g.94485 Transcript_45388/m.94485 type:complete len:83 (-) Transcript_45388:71-319(-)
MSYNEWKIRVAQEVETKPKLLSAVLSVEEKVGFQFQIRHPYSLIYILTRPYFSIHVWISILLAEHIRVFNDGDPPFPYSMAK